MKQITVNIDLSGRTFDCQGPVDETPKISMSATGLSTMKDAELLSKIQKAIRDIVKPQPVKE